MPQQASAELQPLVSRTQWDERIGEILRAYVGRGKRWKSAREIEGPSGVAGRAIEAARCYPDNAEHRHLPSDKAFSVIAVLGPEAMTQLVDLVQMLAIWQPEADPTEPAALGADNVDDAAAINRLTRDNDISESDRRVLRPVGVRMMQRGARLAAVA